MNPEWLCYVNGQEYGPYTWPQLVQMAAAGNVVPQTHVRRNFDSQWYLAEQVPGLFAPVTPANPKVAVHPATAPRTSAASGVSKAPAAAKPAARMPPAGAPAAPTAVPPAAAILPEPAVQAPAFQPTVPKGRAVAPAAAATATAPAQENKPKWIPVDSPPSAAPAVAVAPRTHDEAAVAPKKADSKQLVLYLGAAIAGVALLGGAALIWKFTRPPEEDKPLIAAPVVVPTTEIDPNLVAEEANPAAEANPAGATDAKPATKTPTTPAVKTTNASKQADAAPAAALAVLKTVKDWKQIEKFASFRAKPGLQCTRLHAYLAADATGRKVNVRYVPSGAAPADNAAAAVGANADANVSETPPIIAPTPSAPPGSSSYVTAEPAPFLFVEFTVTNPEPTPRTFAGWNSGETAALLVDVAGKPFTLLPAAATPNVKRGGAKEMQPGETLQDTLVFAVPPDAEMKFRLALPKPAFTPKLTGAWAYEITGASLVELASASESGTSNFPGVTPGQPMPLVPRSSTTIPIPGLQDVPPPPAPPQPAAEPVPEMKKEDKPPVPMERIPIPGLTDVPENKPAGTNKPVEVPNPLPPKK